MRSILSRVPATTVTTPLRWNSSSRVASVGVISGRMASGGYTTPTGGGYIPLDRRWFRTRSGGRWEKNNNQSKTREQLERLKLRERTGEGGNGDGEGAKGQGQGQGEGEGGEQGEGGLEEAMTKGKLLTTPSRLFKLLIPLSTGYHREHKDIEPIAILVHPQQPLSHLERLIQSEVPPIKTKDNQTRSPTVSFIALQIEDHPIRPRKAVYEGTGAEVHQLDELGRIDDGEGKRTPTEDDTYTYFRRTESDKNNNRMEQRFVRWSQSTEIGDFIRDAARAREFIVSVEGAPAGLHQIRVEVPSFDERTHFLRMRLRKISGRIQGIAEIKHECDALAHRGAQRVAVGGFGILASWWYLVYKLTFETELGWDTMEPVTYLASLSTLMGGYLWFLYHNREISYRSALDFTINARQKKLYQDKGVDLHLWESLIDEGNTLRKEIKSIAAEYDVEWDEMQDERDERVTEALKQERTQKNGSKRDRDEDEGDD